MEHFLFALLNEADGAKLSICCDDRLQAIQVRLECEKVAISEARSRGLKCLNKGKGVIDSLAMQRFRLESKEKILQRELQRVRAKLEQLDLASATQNNGNL